MKHETAIHFRLPSEMSAWLERAAAKKLSTVSQVIREILAEKFDTRHAK